MGCVAMSLETSFEAKLNQLTTDLRGESDRATVIIAAAHLDVLLDELLKQVLVPCSTENDSLFDGPNAPLHNLSNKIDLCFRLGLISEFISKSLHIVRKIRNSFAHAIVGCTFTDPAVKSRIEELHRLHRRDEVEPVLKELFDTSPRQRFLLSIILLIGVIQEIQHNAPNKTAKPAEWPFLPKPKIESTPNN
jgi:DNA-binding MltR family transcriptional regulator